MLFASSALFHSSLVVPDASSARSSCSVAASETALPCEGAPCGAHAVGGEPRGRGKGHGSAATTPAMALRLK